MRDCKCYPTSHHRVAVRCRLYYYYLYGNNKPRPVEMGEVRPGHDTVYYCSCLLNLKSRRQSLALGVRNGFNTISLEVVYKVTTLSPHSCSKKGR